MANDERQTKTIHEYLAENPNVDVSETHAAFWEILTELKDRVAKAFPIEQQPVSQGLDYWSTEDQSWEGSMTTYTGPQTEHVAHSWIGNRKNSILDMNFQCWLGQQIDVPHLVVVFGTIPQIFYYCELVARRDIMVDVDYLERYYEEENADFLAMRGDPRFTWSVSHGTYMRALNSPVCHSYTAERSTETVDVLREATFKRFDRWMNWVENAKEVPADERKDLMKRDHLVREYGYTLDPMNVISERMLGKERTQQMLEVRYGKLQIEAAEAAAGIA
jgi:Red chlorophyll catabolite reductase (RCC reductase)